MTSFAHPEPDASASPSTGDGEPLTMWILVRKDLKKSPYSWSTGSIIAQAAHASSAVLYTYKHHPSVISYQTHLECMRKVALEVHNKEQLLSLSAELKEHGLLHYVWMEPDKDESIPTCIATIPAHRSEYGGLLSKLSLYR
ncbi:hypothetical protein SeMB42_g00995 [Synchytrium endobioticum]|uniref:peptidyl-tRNA hydrolase n=1 Tax=Synchytrium endobioticum TaxID=286115 RepID=A0A507DND8_9FUNG|nr:hypothetical protein SeMB42_g00995 [Synchytrium endobioticum]